MSSEGWHFLAAETDLASGDAKTIDVAGISLALFNVDGEFHCVSGICTHEFALLADGFVDGNVVECPLHGACFDMRTGKALSEPAERNLIVYPIRREGGQIFVSLEVHAS